MDVAALVKDLDGVSARTTDGRTSWRYRGRLVARELDDAHVVIRTRFDAREALLARSPRTFSVPRRYARHMMVVADLAGDPEAVRDALFAAWSLQAEP